MAGGSTAGSLKLNKSSFTLSGVASNDTLTYTTDGGGSMSTPRVKVSVETVTLVNAAGTVLQELPIKVADDQVSVTGSYQIPLDLAKSYPSINYANLRVIAHYKQVTQSDMGDTTTYFDYVQNLTVYFTNALYAPTCALTYEEASEGLAEKFGAFIQIYSSVKTTPQFTGKYGATLKTGTITFDGGFKNFDATTNDLVFSNIKTSGNQKLECKVTDSRGNTFTIPYTLNILAYTLPQLTSVILDRCDENGEHNDHGRYALVEVTGSITPLEDKNDKSLIVNYKLPEDEAWASQDISSLFVRYVVNGKAVIGTGDFDPTLTYNFKVSLRDTFNVTEVAKNITTATPLLDFHESGTGIAIGGSANRPNMFDIQLPFEIMGKAFLEYIYPIGSVYSSKNNQSPSDLFGFGSWERIKGKMIVGVDEADPSFATAGEMGGAKTHTQTIAEMPSHTHVQNSHGHTQVAHNHGGSGGNFAVSVSGKSWASGTSPSTSYALATKTSTANATPAINATTATNKNTGGGEAMNIMNPYIALYIWTRVA